ncbi:MAG: alpha/beta fold hydrolase [Xanthomonadales bacterium]|nr:alpha/beta fold hydrolase [Xanthomonadales bacterium]
MSGEPVLLLHGLWMRRPAMWALARCLRQAGYVPEPHPYATILGDLIDERRRLAQHWASLGPRVHVIGHSLGGHLALATATAFAAQLPPGRIICLASPLAGSSVARQLRQHAWGRPLMGRAGPVLTAAVSVPAGREVASIAGQRRFGAGSWLAQLDSPHDGTVSVAETRIDGLAAHTVIPASHSGIVFSQRVQQLCLNFLREGGLTDSPTA